MGWIMTKILEKEMPCYNYYFKDTYLGIYS